MQGLHGGFTPEYEYQCVACGSKRERYFPCLAKAPESLPCGDGARERGELPGCGAPAIMVPSVPAAQSFAAFTTRNLAPDGSAVHVTSRSHLRELMRRYNVREAQVNHNMYGGDIRSVPLNPGLDKAPNPKKRIDATKITHEEAKALATVAERTSFGTRRA